MIPLFTTGQVRKVDEYAIKELGLPGLALMENASYSIFKEVVDYFHPLSTDKWIGIVAGKGNNGGDGFALARHFINHDYRVFVVSLGSENDLQGDALTNYIALKNLVELTEGSELNTYSDLSDLDRLEYCDLVIDAMLGTGAKGQLRSPYDKIVEKLNSFGNYKAAIDNPTGLDADTGSGDIVFSADITVTLAALKRGLYIEKGYEYSGEIRKGYIGIGEEKFDDYDVSDYLVEPEDAYAGLPAYSKTQHKYSAGKVLVIAGSGNFPGAASFTSNSVIDAGGGASILAFPDKVKGTVQTLLDSAIVLPYRNGDPEYFTEDNLGEIESRMEWADVIALGPGLGREDTTRKAVVDLLESHPEKLYVIDADGIFALGNGVYKKLDLSGNILTPHHKEFADLVGIELAELKNNILEHGRSFAVENKCYLVLKGAPAITFTPQGDSLVNTTGNPGMSTFGAGDVLTGIIAAFAANNEDTESAVVSAVYLHSLSADLLADERSVYSVTANDIRQNFGYAVKFLRNSIVPFDKKI